MSIGTKIGVAAGIAVIVFIGGIAALAAYSFPGNIGDCFTEYFFDDEFDLGACLQGDEQPPRDQPGQPISDPVDIGESSGIPLYLSLYKTGDSFRVDESRPETSTQSFDMTVTNTTDSAGLYSINYFPSDGVVALPKYVDSDSDSCRSAFAVVDLCLGYFSSSC